MHVMLIAPEGLPIPPTRGGSVQIYVQALVKRLAMTATDLQVTLVSPGRPATRFSEGGVRHEVYALPRGSKPPRMGYQRWVRQRINELLPDVIQVENRPLFAYKLLRHCRKSLRLAQTKVVLNLHSSTFVGSLHASHTTVRKWLLAMDSVVMNSRYLEEAIKEQFHLSTQFRGHVIYPGVERERFALPIRHPAEDSQEQPVHHPVRLVFIGRVIQLKGVTVLIQAVRRLVRKGIPVQLTIIGRTPPWERKYGVNARRLSQGLPVVWRGFIKPDKLPHLLAGHDILVCPSQRREAFGLVNLEAMAAGKPVIASHVGGIPEVVNRQTGVLVGKYKSPQAFANAIEQLITHPGKYRELQSGALKQAEAFSWEATAQGFYQLYGVLIRKRPDS